jgi:hypothetical protein
MDTVVALGVGAALLVGLAGTVMSRLPGVPLSWTAVLVWASIKPSTLAWTVVGVATLLAVANYLLQHRMAGGAWSELSVADRSWIIGSAVAVAGLFLARLPGLIFGFVGGVYLAERRRLTKEGTARNAAARPGAQQVAVLNRAALVEFTTATAISAAWLLAYAG